MYSNPRTPQKGQRGLSIVRLCDDFEIRVHVEHVRHSGTHDGMIVNEQKTNHPRVMHGR
jgi:hypothetical protein